MSIDPEETEQQARDRYWRAVVDALHQRLRDVLAPLDAARRARCEALERGEPAPPEPPPGSIQLESDEVRWMLWAIARLGILEPEVTELRARLRAIEETYAEDRSQPAKALDAGRIESRTDPRLRKRAALASVYRRLIEAKGTIHISRAEAFGEPRAPWRFDPEPGERFGFSAGASPVFCSVEAPLKPADAVRLLAQLYHYETAPACLRALERERDRGGAVFHLPARNDIE